MANHAPIEVRVTLHGVVLDSDGVRHREDPRSPGSRQERYDERFDTDTLFYDVFRVDSHVELIGPPLLNLREVCARCPRGTPDAATPGASARLR